MRLILFFGFCLLSQLALAFPENVRHGYFNCTACHFSPSGGGLLTDYGRSLSRELMSTWGHEKETRFLYFYDQTEKPLKLGGDVRMVQTWLDNKVMEKSTFIPMQADLEAGYELGKWVVIASAGLEAEKEGSDYKLEEFLSRKHYVIYRATDEWNVRAGKFAMQFGVGMPDHVISTRRDLYWDASRETYNLEVSYLGEKMAHYLTYNGGGADSEIIKDEKGFSASSYFYLIEKSRLGVSYFHGEDSPMRRDVAGLSGIISFTEKLYLQSEFDWQWITMNDYKSGYGSFHRFNWEVYKGVVPFIQWDQSRVDIQEDSLTKRDTYSFGVQWFPRPHWELAGFFGKQYVKHGMESTYAWLMLHFYL